jgi:hypothetical protein
MLGTKPRRKYPDPDEVARMINEEYYAQKREEELRKKREELTKKNEPNNILSGTQQPSLEELKERCEKVLGLPSERRGRLHEILPLFNLPSIHTSADICKARLTQPNDIYKSFWTADSVYYGVNIDDTVTLYLGKINSNLFLQDLKSIPKVQTVTPFLYLKNSHDALASQLAMQIVSNNTSYSFTGLNPSVIDSKFCLFSVDTTCPYMGLWAQVRFVSDLCDYSPDFEKYMGLLKDNGVEQLKISLLNPEYVRNACSIAGSSGLWQPCLNHGIERSRGKYVAYISLHSAMLYSDSTYVRGMLQH